MEEDEGEDEEEEGREGEDEGEEGGWIVRLKWDEESSGKERS